MTAAAPLLIVGGGPVGLALALMLSRRAVRSIVVDARTIEQAQADRRLLALSRGTLQLLAPLIDVAALPAAPIRSVVVSSAGEFGRVGIGADDLGPEPLGATVRYGDLLGPLARACDGNAHIEVRRPCRLTAVRQQPQQVVAELDGGTCAAPLLINAEGTPVPAAPAPSTSPVALIADAWIAGPASGTAFERFTREGPLALLPLPRSGPDVPRDAGLPAGAQPMALVWCMPQSAAERRRQLPDAGFLAELQQSFGRSGRLLRVGPRTAYVLHQQAREQLHEHRVIWIGNAAQTLHPVAGQGLNLGMRDAAALADQLARAGAAAQDPVSVLDDYARRRRVDRAAIVALTRTMPGLFATRAAPVALGRSLALAALSALPDARRQFARLLMFGVRA